MACFKRGFMRFYNPVKIPTNVQWITNVGKIIGSNLGNNRCIETEQMDEERYRVQSPEECLLK